MDVPSADGWANAKKYHPHKFDLCLLKTPTGTLKGWHTGTEWDGLRIKESDTVLSWKRIKDE